MASPNLPFLPTLPIAYLNSENPNPNYWNYTQLGTNTTISSNFLISTPLDTRTKSANVTKSSANIYLFSDPYIVSHSWL